MATYLHQRRAQLTVIAVGGAINTLYLRTRSSTHDVDIFGSMLDTPARMLLDEAMQHAMRQVTTALGTDWFNTENQMWLSPDLHRQLTNEAVEQNVVIFHKPGLRILAAPWNYSFSGKVQRLLTGGQQVRPYDLSDAVHYLHQIVTRNNGQPVPVATVQAWAQRFHHQSSKRFLSSNVNAEYKRVYKRSGIV
ncbi:hypothetical protein BDV06DRAFT_83140 [Aspergillus oleicola]